MIPKKIHYCWFGGNPLSELAEKCIQSWKKMCPDYEIIEWNEKNYDINKSIYIQEAYKEKKWAFVSDYARLDIIYNQGGFYLDTDVELLKSLDCFYDFDCVLAQETSGYIATGLGFGAIPKHDAIKAMLQEYDKVRFIISEGLYDNLPCPQRNTLPFKKNGYIPFENNVQTILGATIFPPEYFCPLNYETDEMNITKNTVSIHHYNASWISEEEREIEKLKQCNNSIFSKIILLKKEYKVKIKNPSIKKFFIFICGKIKKKLKMGGFYE
ncbi:glycosyltransferase family 32 protein [Longibaculum muris]|uniref:glycosyltransferase family 32 protein n=1 Tax=Longibaculum muris TaxID=1796628 RepID=UPI001E499627|nr:glycosyltransferase [Longibaculum muris]